MGRKPKPGLREAILEKASEEPSSASMLHEALERRPDAEPATLTGVIKAAEGLRAAGMLRTTQAMPESYRGARTRTYYTATPKGKATLAEAIASAVSGWTGSPKMPAAPSKESAPHDNLKPRAAPAPKRK